ncbi:MAG: tetratricopeptide repeat protein, partial [Bacteroidia bacterium]|nr:tetratricopeptide repeat protein [Bacteroidia bacterium]
YPKRAKTNATALRYLGSVSGNQGDYPKAIEYYEKSLKIKEEIGDKTNLAKDYPMAAKVYIHLNMPEKAIPLFLKSQEITLYLFKDNFSILSEKEKELYLNETKSVFNDLHSFNIHYSEQYDSLPGICYNNELILKGLLLKSTRSMLDAVYKSSDPELKNTYFYLKQLRNQISELQGADIEDREQKIAELEKQANEQERNLVRLSSEFADIQKLFDYKWEDVQRALKPGDAAIEFVSFADELSVSNSDNEIASASRRNDEEKPPRTNSHALYQLIWQPLERALEGINTVYYAPVRVLNKISFFVLSNESGKFRTSDAVRSFAR